MDDDATLTDRQRAIRTRARQLRHRQRIPAVKSELKLAGVDLSVEDFLSLEETDRLVTAFVARKEDLNRTGSGMYWTRKREEANALLLQLAGKVGDLSVVMLETWGDPRIAFILPANIVLTDLAPTLDLRDRDVSIMTPEGESGLCFEQSYYDHEGRYVPETGYEIHSWGRLTV